MLIKVISYVVGIRLNKLPVGTSNLASVSVEVATATTS